MNAVKDMLFTLQRFQILALFSNPQAQRNVSPAYAFAWSESIYPALNASAIWHRPYADQFLIKEPLVDDLHKLICTRWDAKNPVTFYDLEDHFNVSGLGRPGPVWTRASLIKVCRYLYLADSVNDGMWAALLENGKCPTEAQYLTREFCVEDIYFE